MKKDKRQYKILVVEDNLGDFVLIEEFLDEQVVSPEIDHAKSFREAKQFLQDNKDEYNTIFLDLSLPDMSGEELIKEMIKYSGNTPVVVLTGYTDMKFSIKSLSMGVSDYLLKDELNGAVLYKSIVYNMERQSASAKLRDSERRYRELFHFSPQPMWVFDLTTLVFLDVNEAAVEHYGYRLEEFLNMTILELHPENKNEVLESLFHHDSTPGSIDDLGVVRHKKKNGEIIEVEIKARNFELEGRPVRLILANDITERLNYINAIENQNDKLQEIAWIQSHKVRAPLARIMGLLDSMNLIDAQEMSQEEVFKHVIDSAHELDGIIKNILSKTEQIKLDKEE